MGFPSFSDGEVATDEACSSTSMTAVGMSKGREEGGSIDMALLFFLRSSEEDEENAEGGSLRFIPDEGESSAIEASCS